MNHPKHAIRLFCAGVIIVLGSMWWLLRGTGTDVEFASAAERNRTFFPISRKTESVPEPEPIETGDEIRTELDPYPVPTELIGVDLLTQTQEMAHAKSWGCIECHKDSHDPHYKETLHIGCTDCHGGDASTTDKLRGHVFPSYPGAWNNSSANPVRSYTLLNHESPAFIRFVNPGDLRVAHLSCGTTACHPNETLRVKKSMMTHGCMLWGAALYNNGGIQEKRSRYGESYSMHGTPQRLQTVPPPTAEEMRLGVVPFLEPLPRYNIMQPGNILRIFEQGGRFGSQEVGIPEQREEPGRPRARLSVRGLGTGNRTDPVFLGLQKTRLLDPTLNFMGTNDNPGDYRSSGCTSCHVIYANDRSPVHSGPFAKYGNRGLAAAKPDDLVVNVDPTIRKDESGHPIEHRFTRSIPTSQCIVCHIHPGTTVMNSYIGYMWWDEESDGHLIYPDEEMNPTAEEFNQSQARNPNESAARSRLSDPEFTANLTDLNEHTRHNHFADFHGHGWAFRAVFKKNRDGQLVDHHGEVLEHVTPADRSKSVALPALLREAYRDGDIKPQEEILRIEAELEKLRDHVPVHMLDIHMEKGMHCVDCHFVQDVHGNSRLQMEVRAAVEIQCIDCHGTTKARPTLRTTGPASYSSSPEGGRDLSTLRTPSGKKRFERRGDQLIQNSMVEPNLSWEVSQVVDTIDPRKPQYNALSALAKTIRFKDGDKKEFVWGDIPADEKDCAHSQDNMSCITCHSSWNPSCYGCHLPQKADKKIPELHNEGDVTKNYISYNFMTLRDDVYMLARDGDATSNRLNPARSSCAIHVGSYNGNRESIYVGQQTISAEGQSGIAFSTNVPHTVRGRGETKTCADCHISEKNDNNAVIAQLMMQGTNYLNFIGKYAWVAAGEHGLFGVVSTERDEPQAVIGSTLHATAFPQRYEKHLEEDRLLEAHEHPGNDIVENLTRPFRKPEVLSLQARGEYLYAACGPSGLRVYDIAFIDHKGFAERITTAPVSPFGQKFYVRTKYATAVAAPTTIAPDPTRTHMPENEEQPIHALYAYLYVADRYEGLILVGAGTLLDGDPTNNFLKRALTFNPNGVLNGAEGVTIVGTYAYVSCDCGLVVIDLNDPLKPQITSILGGEFIHKPHAVQVQFRYGFVCDEEGVKVIDTTDLAHPKPVTALALPEAHNIYLARTYAYVAGGHQGLVILDIKNPEEPKVDQIFNANGCINDLHDVKLGITYVSEFAYLADGKNGMRIVQLTSPDTPGNEGFSPRPTPALIATFEIPKGGHALAISKGIDRDRAVDESGNQIAVFGRVGARPMHLQEQQQMYLRPDGSVWKVNEAAPDYTILDHWKREATLQRDLESYYGKKRVYRRPRPAVQASRGRPLQ